MKVKKPCGHNVLVKLKKVEEVSRGGIITSLNTTREQKAAEQAYVEMLGPSAYKGFDDGTPWCEVGDLVAIKMYSGVDYTHKGEVYRVLLDDDVMAVLEDEQE